MMKFILGLLMLFQLGFSQKWSTRVGVTHFKAVVPSFEPVQATSQATSVIYNEETKDVAALLFIPSFEFKIALMEEHFNENYMESENFPKTTFRGKLKRVGSTSNYLVSGDLTIKNKTQKIEFQAILKEIDHKVQVLASFQISPEDFGIEIPKMIRHKIAKQIEVSLDYVLEKK